MSPNNHSRLSLSSSILAGVVLMFAIPLSAQTASYSYIDQKAPYKNQKSPMLTALNLPKVGTTFKVSVPNGAYCGWWSVESSNTYYLAFGVSNPNVPIPALGGFLFTSADIVLPVPKVCPSNTGSVTMSFPIPNSPQLVGVRFYQQVLHRHGDAWVIKANYDRLSRGGVGVIGK